MSEKFDKKVIPVIHQLRQAVNAVERARKDDYPALVAAQVTTLEKAGIRILDLSNPEHQTYAEHLQFAQMRISGSRFHDRRRAKRIGHHGGTAKGAAMLARRNARVADDIVERLCSDECPLSWKLRAWVLGDGFSATSLYRQHGNR